MNATHTGIAYTERSMPGIINMVPRINTTNATQMILPYGYHSALNSGTWPMRFMCWRNLKWEKLIIAQLITSVATTSDINSSSASWGIR